MPPSTVWAISTRRTPSFVHSGGAPPRPGFGLFLLAPFVGEFLLGNLTLADPWLGLLLAPLYGCGALLVRELGRRGGGGGRAWCCSRPRTRSSRRVPVDQLLWNDSYAGEDLLSGDSFIPDS